MKTFRLIGHFLQRLVAFREEGDPKGAGHKPPGGRNRVLLGLMMSLLVGAATPALTHEHGKDGDRGPVDSHLPLAFDLENTGARYPTPNFPPFDKLPIIRPLPDPFQFVDGWRDARPFLWERRRNEIKAAVETYMIGPKPDCSDCTITASWVPPTADSTTGRGTLTVVVTRNGKSVTLTSGVWLPSGMGNGPFPALIGVAFFPLPGGPNYGFLPPESFANQPIATVDFVHNQVANYTFSLSSHATDPFYQLYPELCAGVCNGTSNSGEFAAWAWGVSRLIDGMMIASRQATDPLPVDTKHLGITGCSYAGKIALYAGAFDERIALTIPQENGGGGAPAWRVSHEIEAQGTVEDIDDTDYDWFGGQMRQFAGANVYKMPVDQHELLAMVAPRALLQTGNTVFYWLSNGSNYVSSRAAQRIYRSLGVGDRFGFYIDGNHNHCATLPAEAPVVKSFVDRFLLGKPVSTDVEVYPNPADTLNYGYPIVIGNGGYAYYFPEMDYRRWTQWWGTGKPEFPNDWNTGGTVVASMKTDLDVRAGDTLKVGYDLKLLGHHPAATVSVVSGANVSLDIRCRDGSSYTLTIGLPAQSYAFTAGAGPGHSPSPPHSPEVYQGSAVATPPAGSTCTRGHVSRAYFSATGVSQNGAGNPGGPGLLTTDVTDPLSLSFHVLNERNGQRNQGGPLSVQWAPLESANSTNKNPVTP